MIRRRIHRMSDQFGKTPRVRQPSHRSGQDGVPRRHQFQKRNGRPRLRLVRQDFPSAQPTGLRIEGDQVLRRLRGLPENPRRIEARRMSRKNRGRGKRHGNAYGRSHEAGSGNRCENGLRVNGGNAREPGLRKPLRNQQELLLLGKSLGGNPKMSPGQPLFDHTRRANQDGVRTKGFRNGEQVDPRPGHRGQGPLPLRPNRAPDRQRPL